MNEMQVYQSNLLMALNIAIRDQERVEKDGGYTRDSAFLGGLRDAYKHIQQGGQIHILSSRD